MKTTLKWRFALLEGEKNPSERHVHLAFLWLDSCARDIELDEYTAQWRKQHELSEEEYNTIKEVVERRLKEDLEEHGGIAEETILYRLIEYVAKNSKGQRDEVAAYASTSPKTVSQRANFLKGLQLLRSDQDGYHFTSKGVRFFKRWISSDLASLTSLITPLSGVKHDEKHSEGSLQATLGGIKEKKSAQGVTPKTRELRNIKEVMDRLRVEFRGGIEEDFLELVQRCSGLTKEKGKTLFDRLVDQGRLGMDPEGFWMWVSEKAEKLRKEEKIWWEGLHVNGPYTPDKAYEKTVKALREYVKIEHNAVIPDIKLEDCLSYYWTSESYKGVTERLVQDGIIKPLSKGAFSIDFERKKEGPFDD